jgi:hypothetical protein
VSDSSALHSRWLLLLKIEISSIVHCCFSLSQNELNYCSYIARSSLTYIPGFSVKFFFQPIFTDTHPGTIPARLGLIWFSGFRGEDLNVKVYDGRRMPSDGKSSRGLWPGELKMGMVNWRY